MCSLDQVHGASKAVFDELVSVQGSQPTETTTATALVSPRPTGLDAYGSSVTVQLLLGVREISAPLAMAYAKCELWIKVWAR